MLRKSGRAIRISSKPVRGMLNNLKLARKYVARKVDVDLLYFHATEMTGDLEGILDRSPSAWRPWVRPDPGA